MTSERSSIIGTSAFHYLVRGDYKDNKNLFNRVAELILTNGQDINLENKSGETPLHGACLEGRHLCIRWLVEHNVNVHVTNKYGDTPLHYAARKGAEDAVTILLEAGADPFVSVRFPSLLFTIIIILLLNYTMVILILM